MDMTDPALMPDTVILNDGTKLHGLIVRNDVQTVTLQERMKEVDIPKSSIRRIDDQGQHGVSFTGMVGPGKLPPWRMIVQDLRSDDDIQSFRQIPATTIDSGYLKNIPYLSFRINRRTEMNVYGNPEDPVCIEFGVYERGEKITQFKKIIRAYLAGILSSRAQIHALYGLKESGDEKTVGGLTFKVLPPSAPDAYGGWWLSVYEPKRLEGSRVSDAQYKKETLPFHDVNTRNGELKRDQFMKHDQFLSATMMSWQGKIPDLLGFYRDKMGVLQPLISSVTLSKPSPSPKSSPSPSPAP